MLKFRCNHCGHRLATPRQHLGKLVVCPECGRSTHPLAGQIDSARDERDTASKSKPANQTATAPASMLCGNCGRSMGRLEPQRDWAGHVVCVACHDTLAGALAVAEAPKVAPLQSTSNDASIPTVYAEVQLAAPAGSRPLAARQGNTGELRVIPISWRQRPLILLAGLCIAGSAAYGALSLLRDLAGLLAFVALVLLAGALALVLLRVLLNTDRRPSRRPVLREQSESEGGD